ncbi:MAG: ThuA domain-containing protein [Chitinophagaceae bacterium]|nr:ThuA domain-containing protein [Chitinophagaceae bacterium]
MKRIALFSSIIVFTLFIISCSSRSGKPRILVFAKTAAFRHSSIPNGKAAIMKLGQENGFDVDTTENADYISEDSLKNYSAVIFLHTTGNMLNNYQEADFERYIQAGGGYVGIHAASDAEYDWGWYGRLVGGYFESHPQQQEAKLDVVDQTHISTSHLPKEWKRKDEWYNFKKLNPDVKVLIKIDEKSYEGGKNGDNHPMAWYHDFDGGRAYYTELGHTEESFTDDNYLKHLLGGIKYAMGDNKELKYGQAKTLRVPEEDRFAKIQLTQGTLFEPTEMTILPNFDVLIGQRRGELMLYRNSDKSIKQAGFLNVYFKTNTPGVNAEEGLLGVQADPNFDKNHFVYIFYSPIDTSVNRLSRFKFENDTLDMKSEKVVLQFYSQREICCHTGGSIAFGADNMLFLSTGDNSTPFDQPGKFHNNGFAPLDQRPGFEQYDARRSSGNSNDLRGKILRIKIKDDGTYEIPDGNLFAKGTANTRPEIYVMGNRNPYRISVDKKNGYLYWGEVGPDAANDSMSVRGPRGYDELNQAKKAGFFGWPLFVGNNYPYHEYDYSAGATGVSFDAAKPVNNSPNNTGVKELPAVSPAFIWYPYAESADFPQMGTGGRNAMAGPAYYTDMYAKEKRLPDYYNGKVFIYEWMRNFIKVVTLDSKGDFDKMEPFMSTTKLAAVIDMEVAPDGSIYLLEYGSGWFSKNPDAGLSKIEYTSGNRAPKISSLTTNRASGSIPFKVTATVEAEDPEKDKMTYVWDMGNGEKKETTEPKIDYEYPKAGDYTITVEVSDDKKSASKSNAVNVYAGNETPEVNIAITSNKTFYFPGKQVQYAVTIDDRDDTAKSKDLSNLIVSADYLEGSDRAASPQGHQVLSAAVMGRNLMLSLDCKNCHQVDQKSIGPAYTAVAKKYEKDPNASNYLADKIIKGGSGVWGEVAMAAHPNLKEGDAKQIVTWIQSLSGNANKKSLPATGSVAPTLGKPVKDNGALYISASYTDKGGAGIKPLTANNTVVLRNSKMSFARVKNLKGFTTFEYNGNNMLIAPAAGGYFTLDDIDLTGITGATINAGWQKAPEFGFDFELRLDAVDGTKIGEGSIAGGLPTPKGGIGQGTIVFKISPVTDGKLHNVYIISKPKDAKETGTMFLQAIQFAAQ